MAEIEALQCPKCGATVGGEGEVICAYCDSKLNIRRQPETRAAQTQYIVTFSEHEHTTAFFIDIPGKVVATKTTDIPFQPEVIYDNLPGGRLIPALSADAEEILALFKTFQDSLNAEDLDKCLATYSQARPEYVAEMREVAQKQFIYSDMKRYTISIDFIALSPERAEVMITAELLTFPVSGTFERLDAHFSYQLEKYRGSWKIARYTLQKKDAKYTKQEKVIHKAVMVVVVIFALILLASICVGTIASVGGVVGGIIIAIWAALTGEVTTGTGDDFSDMCIRFVENYGFAWRTVMKMLWLI